jgi:XTP/dITP diphosphohydrolase
MNYRILEPGKLVIATHNAGKLPEMTALLGPYGMQVVGAGALGLPEPAETGTTFAQNALIKAHAAAQASGLPAFADDSGICVAALDGAPGVYTADWAEMMPYERGLDDGGLSGQSGGRDWYMAMGKVEGKLAALGPDTDRSAYFISTLALAWPDGHAQVFEGRANGSLIWPPRGTLGFGYDPVFVPEGYDKTFAELGAEGKQRLSHRAAAFARLVAVSFAAV